MWRACSRLFGFNCFYRTGWDWCHRDFLKTRQKLRVMEQGKPQSSISVTRAAKFYLLFNKPASWPLPICSKSSPLFERSMFISLRSLKKVWCEINIDIERHKNRLLKFCYVPATSTAHNRLLFFSFLLQPFTVLMKQTRQSVCTVKQSIFLDVYGDQSLFSTKSN